MPYNDKPKKKVGVKKPQPGKAKAKPPAKKPKPKTPSYGGMY